MTRFFWHGIVSQANPGGLDWIDDNSKWLSDDCGSLIYQQICCEIDESRLSVLQALEIYEYWSRSKIPEIRSRQAFEEFAGPEICAKIPFGFLVGDENVG